MTLTTTATAHFILSAEEVKTLRKAHEILYKMYEQTEDEGAYRIQPKRTRRYFRV